MRSISGKLAALGAAAACAVAVGACGSDDSGSSSTAATTAGGGGSTAPVKIDVGTKTLSYPAGTKPSIAVFAGSGIAYQSAYQKAAKELAKKYGIPITYFDSKFDPTTQLNQLRSALQNKKFNAWIVENYSGSSACTIETKQAPAANIAVSQITNPTCDQATKPWGDEFWSPGTLNTVGAVSSPTYYSGWVREAKELLGAGDHKVAVINGPPLVAATKNTDAAMKENGLDPVANLNSDYTAPTALKQTADLLQAHRDVDAIFSVGPDSTVGIVSALKAAGKKPGEVKVFDVGGAKSNVKLIKDGWLTMSVPYAPTTTMNDAVASIVDAFAGKQGPHAVPALPAGSPDAPYEITQKTVDEYNPEY
jgi:galactofuranose transport system substrate-binding protein